MSYLLVLLITIALTLSYRLGYTPLLMPAIYAVASLLTLLAYAGDKSAARKYQQRIPENTLHVMALACGWPGAVVAQHLFRHKTQKTSFRIPFWITVLANCAALAWLHTAQGTIYLNTFTFQLETLTINEVTNSSARVVLLTLLGFHA